MGLIRQFSRFFRVGKSTLASIVATGIIFSLEALELFAETWLNIVRTEPHSPMVVISGGVRDRFIPIVQIPFQRDSFLWTNVRIHPAQNGANGTQQVTM